LRLHIFFTPAELAAVMAQPDDIYIVIDVIRATTSLTTIFDSGAKRVLIAQTIEQAQAAAQRIPGCLLCGERQALPLPGFDYGNSPVQFSQADLSGRELILITTNGTRAFFTCPPHSTRLTGCFYNAQAVTARAIQQAQQGNHNIAIVCAGEQNYFALDDSVCAGYLALALQHQYPALQVDESVDAATALYHSYPPSVLPNCCNSARSVIAAGLQEDLQLCMRANGSKRVPMVIGQDKKTGLLVLA